MSGWRQSAQTRYVERDGPAYGPDAPYCNKKLCFTTTDLDALIALLDRLAEREDCYYLKYSPEPHAGMYLGRVFLVDEDAVGRLWHEYRQRAPFFCTLQDDDFTSRFRE